MSIRLNEIIIEKNFPLGMNDFTVAVSIKHIAKLPAARMERNEIFESIGKLYGRSLVYGKY